MTVKETRPPTPKYIKYLIENRQTAKAREILDYAKRVDAVKKRFSQESAMLEADHKEEVELLDREIVSLQAFARIYEGAGVLQHDDERMFYLLESMIGPVDLDDDNSG